MGLAEEVLDAIVMKDTERQARIRVDSGRVLLHMCLFLHSFKLPKQKDRGVLDGVRLAFHLRDFGLLLNDVFEDGVVDGQSIDSIKLFDELEAHGASHSAVPGW